MRSPITKRLRKRFIKIGNAFGRSVCHERLSQDLWYPASELADDTPIKNVRFSTRIRNALNTAGLKTVGEIREASDATLLSLQNCGESSVAHLRETLGLPSTDGVRPSVAKGK
jgi:DNA-directed RNA polymerase alpha subunit